MTFIENADRVNKKQSTFATPLKSVLNYFTPSTKYYNYVDRSTTSILITTFILHVNINEDIKHIMNFEHTLYKENTLIRFCK